MRVVRSILLVALILLSLATGLVKVFGFEQDNQIFASLGFSPGMTSVFGAVQVVGGALLVHRASRRVGAAVMALTFVVATTALFASGHNTFGLFSILFIGLAAASLWPSASTQEVSHG